jgi:hypothetical protein
MGIPCFNRCSVKHLLRFVASLAPAWTGPALVRRQLVGLAAVLVGLLRLIHPPADGGQLDARLLAGERTALAALQSGEALGQVVAREREHAEVVVDRGMVRIDFQRLTKLGPSADSLCASSELNSCSNPSSVDLRVYTAQRTNGSVAAVFWLGGFMRSPCCD